MVGNSGLSYGCSRATLLELKKSTLVDYASENFFVNLLPCKCNGTGWKKLDVCMDLKLIKYGISGSRGLGAVPPDAVALLT